MVWIGKLPGQAPDLVGTVGLVGLKGLDGLLKGKWLRVARVWESCLTLCKAPLLTSRTASLFCVHRTE